MAQILLIKGKPETILTPKDFEFYLEQAMGSDSVEYYRNQIAELVSCLRNVADYVNDSDTSEWVEEVISTHGL